MIMFDIKIVTSMDIQENFSFGVDKKLAQNYYQDKCMRFAINQSSVHNLLYRWIIMMSNKSRSTKN
jgi:hypothetical protein